jgi:hypothetical protein
MLVSIHDRTYRTNARRSVPEADVVSIAPVSPLEEFIVRPPVARCFAPANFIVAGQSDSTFRLLLAQLDVEGFEALLQQWMAAQPGVTDAVDTLVCDGKTLRGSIAENASGAARYGLRTTSSTLPR